MELIRIFEVGNPIEQALYTMPGQQGLTEFELFFTKMSDPELVRSFCSKNQKWINMKGFDTIEEVVDEICELAADMEERLLDCNASPVRCKLDDLFHSIGTLGTGKDAVQTCLFRSDKAKANLPYPELYALQLEANCYAVTGGRISVPNSPNEAKEMDEVRKKWNEVYEWWIKN